MDPEDETTEVDFDAIMAEIEAEESEDFDVDAFLAEAEADSDD